jgi:PAS domain S-box-containing protein
MRVPAEHSRWVLNVESDTENAFAAEEIETLSLLVREAGFILERAALLETRKAVLKAINDGVVETNEMGLVREANPAAEALFGYKTGDLRDRMLGDLVHDDETAGLIARQHGLQRRETVIVREDGQQVPVLISGALMPDDLGGKVFVVSDLTYQKELHRIDLIKEVFRQAAFESKIPLSLAASYLSQVIEGRPVTRELVEKTLKQLTRVDLPLERLLRLATGNTERDIDATAPLAQTVQHVLRELPDAEATQVDIQYSNNNMRVPVGCDTLAFCVESMLSFAFRTRPLDRKVRVELAAHDDVAHLSVRGDWSPLFNTDAATDFADRWRQRAIIDLSLGGGLIEDVATRAGGRFACVLEEDAPLELELELPLVHGGMR